MELNSVLERIISRTAEKAREEGINIDEKDVTDIMTHIFDRIEYHMNMNKQGLMKIGYIALRGIGKLVTKDYYVFKTKRRMKKKNPQKYHELYGNDMITNFDFD